MPAFEQLLTTVAALLDETSPPGELLALTETSAAVAMPDGSVANLVTVDHAPPVELAGKLDALVRRTRGVHLKLCIFGGDATAREGLRRAQPWLPSGRAVQVFHLSSAGEVWVGRGTRIDSPFGRALERAADDDGAAPAPEALAARITQRRSEAKDSELRQGREFVDRMLARRPLAAPIMLGVLGVVFGLQTLFGGALPPVLERMGANTPASLHGEPQRLLAATFLHGGVVHFLLNGYALFVLGGFLERLLGAAHFVALYVLAAGVGSLTSAWLTGADLGVGASGGICGALGAAAVLAYRPQGILHPLVVPGIRRAALINLVLAAAISFLPAVDAWAHVGGGIAGAAYVLAMHGQLARRAANEQRASRGVRAVAFALGALALGSLVIAMARGRPWTLRAPIPLTDHELAPGVIVRVPLTHDGARIEDPRDGIIVGDLRHDLLLVRATATRHEVAATELPSQLAEVTRSPGWIPAGATAEGSWTTVADAPHPTMQVVWVGSDLRGHVVLQARPRYLVEVEVVRFADGPAAAEEGEAAIVDALTRPDP